MTRRRYKKLPGRLEEKLELQGGKCAYCGYPFDRGEPGRFPTEDHYIPLSAGGLEARANIVAACNRCNFLKGNVIPSLDNGWHLDWMQT